MILIKQKAKKYLFNIGLFILSASLSFSMLNAKDRHIGRVIAEKTFFENDDEDFFPENDGFEQLIEEEEAEEDEAAYIFPVSGTITSYFGDEDSRTATHLGIDIAVPVETEVKAAHSGTVKTAEYSASYGYFVVLENDNIKTVYAHNSKLCVKAGDIVKSGDVIALSGSSGDSTGGRMCILKL